ncbi:MAG TPA: penicillin-binding protein 2 [Actinomycetota bacterium]|nr:penicillin-binding protein 2 [Actinomycetota bacterium]
MTEGRTGLRLKVFAALVAFMFAALTTRLWFLQVLAADQFRDLANQNSVRLMDIPAQRGRILDDHGNLLVTNRLSLVVTVNKQEAGSRLEDELYRLSELLGVPAEELAARVEDPRYYVFQPVPVEADVGKRIDFYVSEHERQFPGVTVIAEPVRVYPEGSLAAHVLGYLGQISPKQLKAPDFAGYRPGDEVGVTGVEAAYERFLRGTEGVVSYRVNSAGQNLGPIGERVPVRGQDVVLTIDIKAQRIAEESLNLGLQYAHGFYDSDTGRDLQANGGAVVVMDPATGAIKALASAPSFDPSLFVRSMSSDEFERRFGAAKSYPLLDRATQGQYPPGSTYKPFVLLSALRRGIVSTTDYYPCPPSWDVPEDPLHEVFHNWTTVDLGSMTLAQALYDSCDTVFYPIGYEYWRRYYPPTDPPVEQIQRDLQAFGFGRYTHVDLPFEEEGRVPDAEWKSAIHKQYPKSFPDGQWFPGDFINMSIGQGDTLVTPLQLAAAYSAIQNGGRACPPHVFARAQEADGDVLHSWHAPCHRIPFLKAQIEYVREALTQVPVQGTAASAFIGFPFSQVQVAGKTGTAQVFGQQDYSWFAAMTQAQGRQYVVVALVEQGGHGSSTAAPIVRRVIEGLYGLSNTQFTYGGVTD